MICCKQRILKIARGFTKEKHVWCIRCCNEAWTSQSFKDNQYQYNCGLVAFVTHLTFWFYIWFDCIIYFFQKGLHNCYHVIFYFELYLLYKHLYYVFCHLNYLVFFFFLHKRGMFWFAHTCTIIIYF